jgi:hypothetical protein
LAEPFSLEKDQIVLGETFEKSKVLLHRPRIKAHRGLHPFGLKVRKVLKNPITAGRYLMALNKKKNLHFIPLNEMEYWKDEKMEWWIHMAKHFFVILFSFPLFQYFIIPDTSFCISAANAKHFMFSLIGSVVP